MVALQGVSRNSNECLRVYEYEGRCTRSLLTKFHAAYTNSSNVDSEGKWPKWDAKDPWSASASWCFLSLSIATSTKSKSLMCFPCLELFRAHLPSSTLVRCRIAPRVDYVNEA
jgi:hypothetical protein